MYLKWHPLVGREVVHIEENLLILFKTVFNNWGLVGRIHRQKELVIKHIKKNKKFAATKVGSANEEGKVI